MSVRAMEKLSADPKVNAAPFRIHLNRETKPVTATSSNTHGKKSIKLMERLKKTDQKKSNGKKPNQYYGPDFSENSSSDQPVLPDDSCLAKKSHGDSVFEPFAIKSK